MKSLRYGKSRFSNSPLFYLSDGKCAFNEGGNWLNFNFNKTWKYLAIGHYRVGFFRIWKHYKKPMQYEIGK